MVVLQGEISAETGGEGEESEGFEQRAAGVGACRFVQGQQAEEHTGQPAEKGVARIGMKYHFGDSQPDQRDASERGHGRDENRGLVEARGG